LVSDKTTERVEIAPVKGAREKGVDKMRGEGCKSRENHARANQIPTRKKGSNPCERKKVLNEGR